MLKDKYGQPRPGRTIAVYVSIFAIVWLLAAGLFAMFTWSGQDNEDKYHYYSLGEYFEEAGFDLTAEHQVLIGSNLEASSGTIAGSGRVVFGIGNGSLEGEVNPASSVRLLLPLEENTHIIAFFPSDMIFLHTVEAENATVRFTFNNVEEYGSTADWWHYKDGDGFFSFSRPIREVNDDIRESDEWATFTQVPLQEQLEAHVERIDLYVTDEQLASILNTP